MKRIIGLLVFLIFIFSCQRNHEPLASEIEYEPDQVSAGAVIGFKVSTYDEDGDPLTYQWESSHGEFISLTDLDEVIWKAPAEGEGQSVTISVVISDGEYDIIREAKFGLKEPLIGSIAGHIFFRNTKIPIPDVKISIANKETTTDNEGYFLLSGLIAGNDSLTCSKPDFSTEKMAIVIPNSEIRDLPIEMLSIVNSSKTYGVISDQFREAVEFAEVILLNPNGSESRLSDITDENGLYRIPYIPHGWHTLKVRKEASDSERFIDLLKYVEFNKIEQEVNLFVEKEILVGEFTDPRDNQIYSYRKIGDYFWMTENLAYLPEVSSKSLMSTTDPHFYVYGYDGNDVIQARGTNNFAQYGVLYNWEAAKISCPPGWYLPSNYEYGNSLGRFLGEEAGHKMKSQTGWYELGNGDNSSGFSAIPGGNLTASDEFSGLFKHAFFYSTAIDEDDNAYYFNLSYNSEELGSKPRSKENGFSVRCIKNE